MVGIGISTARAADMMFSSPYVDEPHWSVIRNVLHW